MGRQFLKNIVGRYAGGKIRKLKWFYNFFHIYISST